MNKHFFIVILFSLLSPCCTCAQELFPNSEPASIVPKKVMGIRSMNEVYKEVDQIRSWNGLMLMYGLSSKWMVSGILSFSNHHGNGLPDNFIQVDGGIGEHTHGIVKGKSYKYGYESIGLGFRYRFFNHDEHHYHFRMALYGNVVYADQAHDEAETNLAGDNTGAGGGIILTYLKNKLAVSSSGGVIIPNAYTDRSKNITLNYGNAINYSLSFGYLVLPFKYKSYDQTNLNVYCEFIGKSYEGLSVISNNKPVKIEYVPAFEKGNYVEVRPALQLIIKSNLRIDFSTAFKLIRRSYVRTYPIGLINIQYYFF